MGIVDPSIQLQRDDNSHAANLQRRLNPSEMPANRACKQCNIDGQIAAFGSELSRNNRNISKTIVRAKTEYPI